MATKVQRICQTTKDITQKCVVRPVCVNVFSTYFLLLPAKCLEFSNKVPKFAGRLLNLSYKNYNLFTNNKRLITMKQKLFTLLTLLLCAVTGSWAEGYYEPTADEVIILKDQYDASKTTTGYSKHDAIAWGGTASTNSKKAGDPSNEGKATSSNVPCYSVKGNGKGKDITVSVTGVSKIIVYHESHNSRFLNIKKNDKDGTLVIKGSTSTYYTEATLDVNKNYSLFLEGMEGTSQTDFYVYAVKLIKGATKTIDTQTFNGVKKGETTLTETTDYTVSGSVITLTAAHKTAVTPSGITLINHITYNDATTQDKNITVAFDGTKTAGYFVSAAATIGATDYTVKVPYDATLTTDKAAYSVISTKANVGTVTIRLTGAELAGAKSITWASAVEGLTVSPEEITVTGGVVDQEFTISYHSLAAVSEATVNLTFAVGSSSVVVPVTYSSTAADVTTITDVTEATTWDWNVTTNDISSPANGYMVPFGNATDAATKFASGFNYQALAGDAQYFARKNEKCFQGTSLKFHTTEAGYITVVFSNTGDNRPYRYLYLNGSKISNDARSGDANKVTVENIAVEAGDVVLSGYIENASDPKSGNNDVVGPQMLRIYKVIFVPSDPTPYCDFTAYQWATYVPTTAVSFAGQPNVEAYIVTGHDGTAIEKTQVTSVPAGTPVLLYKKTEGAGTLHFDNRASSSTDVSANLLKAGTGAAVSAETGKTKYVLSVADGKAVFKKINATAATVEEGKAYLEFDGDVSAPQFNLDGETTGIQAVESQKVAMDNKFYNLAGQQVAAPTKGLYIVNGKKVIIK